MLTGFRRCNSGSDRGNAKAMSGMLRKQCDSAVQRKALLSELIVCVTMDDVLTNVGRDADIRDVRCKPEQPRQ